MNILLTTEAKILVLVKCLKGVFLVMLLYWVWNGYHVLSTCLFGVWF